jgi:hypothetical protein
MNPLRKDHSGWRLAEELFRNPLIIKVDPRTSMCWHTKFKVPWIGWLEGMTEKEIAGITKMK